MVAVRPGRVSLGCLLILLAATVVFYFGGAAGMTYWRFYQYQDRMQQEVEFAEMRTDGDIRSRLRAYADTLELPPEASRILVRRTPRRITVSATYVEMLTLPFVTREAVFQPRAERIF